jgi:alpha-L-fucosidase
LAVTAEEAAVVVPSARQLEWQNMEFYAFIHFGLNTFTGREWGEGKEDPGIFNPAYCNPSQWAEVCKSAGMTGLILTCKHHDGFCLWPSGYTDYSVKSAPWRNGTGDVVGETAKACGEAGLKFGIYLSPWDRHEPSYGDSPAYNQYYLHQLRELLTGYGELFCVWLDGACGEGRNGKKQEYDWDAYYALIRELQPGAVISVCGPDVRWCGNEAGHTRRSEWSVVPSGMRDNERIREKSQQADDREFARRIDSTEEDIGSRSILFDTDLAVWYPAEVNTSIRPGWFYHEEEDTQVKSVETLLDLYERTVGGNSGLLLNLPPDKRGLIPEQDAMNLRLLGEQLRRIYGNDLAQGANLREYCCELEGGNRIELELDFRHMVEFNRILLQEDIRSGQRVERFELLCWHEGAWHAVYEGTVVGYKKICVLEQHVQAERIKLRIQESRLKPVIRSFKVYFG